MRSDGPEKAVEKEVLWWAKKMGFDLTVVDTSAVWNPKANRYIGRRASESLPDLIGNFGPISVWIELKRPGHRRAINHTKNLHQKAFLIRKIKQGCFAVVTDGMEHLSKAWRTYSKAALIYRQQVLLSDLPVIHIAKLKEN